MAPIVHKLADCITCHAWNADRSMVAVCPNSSQVLIYKNCHETDTSKWVVAYTLAQHDMLVSGIDWSPVHNKIVTCSHDRNAFVYTYDSAADSWTAAVVVLRLSRGATDVKWSPDGQKFVVSSALRDLRVCTYLAQDDWWSGTEVKHADKGTMFSAAWHPNSQLIASVSARPKCRVFSANLPDLDSRPSSGPFAEVYPFGQRIVEFDAEGWIEDVAWSPSGFRLAFVAHDSTLRVVTFAEDGVTAPVMAVTRCKDTPFTKLIFANENTIICGGHSFKPTVFKVGESGKFEFHSYTDKESKEERAATSSIESARAIFAARATIGKRAVDEDTTSDSKHQGCITDLRATSAVGAPVTKFSTSGTDGRLVLWDVAL